MPHARTGLELHGRLASLYADQVMTQQPSGTLTLIDQHQTQTVDVAHHDLYSAGIAQFVAAVQSGDPLACDGVAGYRSMAVAMATLESAKSGRPIVVDYGNYPPDGLPQHPIDI